MFSAITFNVRKCTSQYFRATRARDFFSGQRMIHTTVLSSCADLNRNLKTTKDESNLNQVTQTYCWDDEIPHMKAAWKDIVHEITETGSFQVVPETMKFLAEVLEYNIPRGSQRRYLTLVHAYKSLVPTDQLTEENLRLARILGWCCELFFGGFWIYDDVMDNAETRRGRPCWYRKTGIVTNAANYAMVVMYMSLELIRRHLKGHPCYEELFETYQKCLMRSHISGITSDVATNFGKKPYLQNFTIDLYQRLLIFKSNYPVMLPIQLAIRLAGIKDPETLRQAELIASEMGRFFQIQNDYNDCYGRGGTELKTQTDIAQGEITWLIVEALRRVSPEQRQILDECYGEKDLEKVAKVKQVYDDLGMPTVYAFCEDQSYNTVNFYIENLNCGLPHDIFLGMRDNIYGTSAERSRIIQ